MAETVSSVFRPHLKRNVIISSVIIWPVILFLAYSYLNDEAGVNASNIVICLICISIFGYLYFRGIVSMFLKITAAPEGLIFHYLLTDKKIVIDYAEIKHIESLMNMSWRAKSRGIIPATAERDDLSANGFTLKIYLTSGETFTFDDSNYTNYDELKESIRRHRFNLP